MAACKNKKFNCINVKLSTAFRYLGYHVAQHPLRFIIIPVIVTVLSCFGLFRFKMTTDVEYLHFRRNSRITMAKPIVETLYPQNYTDYDILRLTKMEKYGAVIATAKRGESMLLNEIFNELHILDQTIRNMSIVWKRKSYRFADICCKIEGQCIENDVLNLKTKITEFQKGNFKIRYPVNINSESSKVQIYTIGLGGVTTDEHSLVKDFKAIRLIYFIDNGNHTNEISTLWEENFLKLLNEVKLEYVKFSVFTGKTNEEEFNKLTIYNIPIFIISQIFLCSFSVFTCMTRSCVTSKPWIGIAAYSASILGTVAAFGFLLLFGTEYTDLNIVIPIIVVGIGLDDSFVILSAWRKTNPEDSMKKRIGDAYSESATSITITTLTNIAASLIGFATPYRCIRIIFTYMAVSFIFTYLYQLSFFGGCLVLSGYRESKNLHAVYCAPVKWDRTSGLKRIFTVGFSTQKQFNSENKKWNFYSDELGRILNYKITKCIVMICFIIYISFGIYLMKFIKLDLKHSDLYQKNSYAYNFVQDDYQYFSEYRERIQVVIDTPLDYSNPETQQQLEDLTIQLENAPNMSGYNMTESWLRTYVKFIKDPLSWISLSGYNISNPEDFVEALHNVFLKFHFAKRFQRDIVFDEDKKNVIASRFFVNSRTIDSSAKQSELLQHLYNVMDSSGLNAMIYNYDLLFADSFVNVLSYLTQSVCVSSVAVIIVFLIFIPNLHCAFCICFSVLSIVTSTITYSSAWGVNLNSPLTLVLVLIAGFSVDYVSHISCSYMCSKADKPEERMKGALRIAGHPIIQAAGSTVLGISAVSFSSYRILLDIFKIIFLVILFSTLHAIILLPVLLNIWDNIVLIIKRKNSTKEEYISDTSNVLLHLRDNA
ncbi:patched domain-containing protein 3-like [Centruroides sculpturatus]|uniref:patched domain-containing protein 3-like n=1 Tax=Centruroides sculpturatus TaxID=218467 RepID=UPI000C6CD853|nr:patched domain-containing protein 3-like [Centruroides sculpturatus]